MTKPREAWLSIGKYECGAFTSKKVLDGQEKFIEHAAYAELKQAADRLAEAFGKLLDVHFCVDADKALADFRERWPKE